MSAPETDLVHTINGQAFAGWRMAQALRTALDVFGEYKSDEADDPGVEWTREATEALDDYAVAALPITLAADRALAGDLVETLTLISEFLEKYEDVVDDPPHEDGPSQSPNAAMRLRSALEGNDYERGLIQCLMKVAEALAKQEASR